LTGTRRQLKTQLSNQTSQFSSHACKLLVPNIAAFVPFGVRNVHQKKKLVQESMTHGQETYASTRFLSICYPYKSHFITFLVLQYEIW